MRRDRNTVAIYSGDTVHGAEMHHKAGLQVLLRERDRPAVDAVARSRAPAEPGERRFGAERHFDRKRKRRIGLVLSASPFELPTAVQALI